MLLIIYRPSRFVVPELAYNKPDPNKIKQELKLPNKKYGVKQTLLNHYVLAVSIQGSRVLPEHQRDSYPSLGSPTLLGFIDISLVSGSILQFPWCASRWCVLHRGGAPVICSSF